MLPATVKEAQLSTLKLLKLFPTGTWLCALRAKGGGGHERGRWQLQGRDMTLSWGCKFLPTLEDKATELAFSGKQSQEAWDGSCSVHLGCPSVRSLLNLTGPGPQHSATPMVPGQTGLEPG